LVILSQKGFKNVRVSSRSPVFLMQALKIKAICRVTRGFHVKAIGVSGG